MHRFYYPISVSIYEVNGILRKNRTLSSGFQLARMLKRLDDGAIFAISFSIEIRDQEGKIIPIFNFEALEKAIVAVELFCGVSNTVILAESAFRKTLPI